ncbi:MAG: hypothetical protein KDD89_15220, partial [Anaerolineales bacterium]|nr:hypothetical protein [Anaerolineales bacterium]
LLLDDWHTPTAATTASLLRLLQNARSLKIVVTTHERLHLSAEWLLILTGLESPAATLHEPDQIARNPAVALFLTHAQRARGGFAPTATDWQAIAAICRQLGGNPQALIALAASVRLMSLPKLNRLLQTEQLQTAGLDQFEASLAQHWQALAPDLRHQCAALAVFAPTSTTAALQSICNLQLADLADLVEAAFLTQTDDLVQFPPLWQQFVRTQQPPAPLVRQAHAHYYESLLAEQVGALRQQNQPTAVQILTQAQENIVQAWRVLCATHGRVRPPAAWGLFHFYDINGQVNEAQSLLALPAPTPLLQAMQGWFAFRAGQAGMAHQLLLGQADQLGQEPDQQTLALVRCYTAVVLTKLGNLAGAEQELRQAWLISQQLGDLWGNALALNIAGDIAFARANLTRAGELYQQSLTLKRIVQDDWGQAFCLMNLGQVAYAEKRYDEATSYY